MTKGEIQRTKQILGFFVLVVLLKATVSHFCLAVPRFSELPSVVGLVGGQGPNATKPDGIGRFSRLGECN